MSVGSLNWIDYVVVGCTLWALFNGVKRGIVTALVGVLGIVVGYLLVRWIGVPIAGWISQTFSLPHGIAVVGAYVATFSLSCWGIAFLARPTVRAVRRSSLSVVNRLLGGLFTGAFVTLIFSLLFNLIDYMLPRGALIQQPSTPSIEIGKPAEPTELRPDLRDESRLYDPIRGLVHWATLSDWTSWQDKYLKEQASEQRS